MISTLGFYARVIDTEKIGGGAVSGNFNKGRMKMNNLRICVTDILIFRLPFSHNFQNQLYSRIAKAVTLIRETNTGQTID